MANKICSVCEQGHLTAQTELVTVEYLGQIDQIENRYSVCDCCGSEQADNKDARLNKRVMTVFTK